MPRGLKSIKLAVVFSALVWTVWVGAYSTGPPVGFTGAPGEDTCAQCHDDTGPNSGNGSVSLSGLPSVYQLGQRYAVTVQVHQPGQERWGFQVTALTVEGQPAGNFALVDSERTQILPGEEGRTYVEHTADGTDAGGLQGASWRFDWIAPPGDVGPVVFYASGNAANNDGDRTKDFIYTTNQTVSPPSLPDVRLIIPNGGEMAGTGEIFQIRWEASENATGFNLLLAQGGGTLPTLVAAGLPASARSFDWRVPSNLVVPAARITVVAFTNAGSNADDSDRTFSIVDRTPPQVKLILPRDGAVAVAGGRIRIQWMASDNIGISAQDLSLSTDDGMSFTPLAGGLGTSARAFEWTTPRDLITAQAKIRIIARDQAGNVATAANESPFILKKLALKSNEHEPAVYFDPGR
ncbi:MAG: hypothetical protein HY650_08945 [Acidobacteria bacterium]|nr:hypothetical protein [Acidobacteriota bacterium]